MAETKTGRSPFVERIPELKNKKWAGMPNEAAAEVVGGVLKAGKPAVLDLIGGLQEVDTGSDWKERLLLHMLVTQTSAPDRKKERALVAEALVAAVEEERPASVKAFVLQQLRLVADGGAATKLVPLLRDPDPLVVDAAAAVMVSIGKGAEKQLRGALAGAEGHSKVAIQHALNQLG